MQFPQVSMFAFLVSFISVVSLVTASPINGRTPPAWKFNGQLQHNGTELNERQAQAFYITFHTVGSSVKYDNYFEACIPTLQAWTCNVAALLTIPAMMTRVNSGHSLF
jgi:hypothetical protein